MRTKQGTAHSMRLIEGHSLGGNLFEGLESRVLFSTIKPSAYGATVNDGKDDRSAIQAALNAMQSGDTLQFDAGTYTINGTLSVASNRNLQGAANLATKLVFNTATSGYGISIYNDASSVTINGFDITANAGVISAVSRTYDVTVTNNNMSWGSNGNSGNKYAFQALSGSQRLNINNNYFHDALSADRAVNLDDISDSSYSYNVFYKVNDGGHIDGSVTNFKFVGNVGTQFHRMGLELQDHWGTDNNLMIADNVFSNWEKPYGWSFGMSIMPQRATNVTIQNNYISATNFSDGWGDSDQKFGIAIESGFSSGIVQGNTFGGPWLAGVTASGSNEALKNNAYYGKPMWTPWAGQAGTYGNGSISDQGGNSWNTDVSKMPAAPTRAAGPSGGSGSSGSSGSGSSGSGSSGSGSGTTVTTTNPVGDGSWMYLNNQWVSATSGWGPVEVNESNGEQPAGDGKTQSIGGKTYAHGLGVAGNSTITYNLAGKYNWFFSELGIDDEVGKSGSMDFQVWADGKKIYDSGTQKGTDYAAWTQLNVAGVKELKLVTTNAGDGDSYDHGDWANAQIW